MRVSNRRRRRQRIRGRTYAPTIETPRPPITRRRRHARTPAAPRRDDQHSDPPMHSSIISWAMIPGADLTCSSPSSIRLHLGRLVCLLYHLLPLSPFPFWFLKTNLTTSPKVYLNFDPHSSYLRYLLIFQVPSIFSPKINQATSLADPRDVCPHFYISCFTFLPDWLHCSSSGGFVWTSETVRFQTLQRLFMRWPMQHTACTSSAQDDRGTFVDYKCAR